MSSDVNPDTLIPEATDRPKIVYVDEAIYPYRGSLWCHMYSPDLETLHQMARRLRLTRYWFQDKPGFPHYDLSPNKRAAAIRYGAKPVSAKRLVEIVRQWWMAP